jgi:hypothetical protein
METLGVSLCVIARRPSRSRSTLQIPGGAAICFQAELAPNGIVAWQNDDTFLSFRAS